jgi:hypothetical protein
MRREAPQPTQAAQSKGRGRQEGAGRVGFQAIRPKENRGKFIIFFSRAISKLNFESKFKCTQNHTT